VRLPLPAPIESRDGTVSKDGLCKNLLIEQDEDATLIALRPGLSDVTSTLSPSSGNGIVEFNNKLLSVYDATLVLADIDPEPVVSFPTPEVLVDSVFEEVLNPEVYVTSVCNGATVEGYSDVKLAGWFISNDGPKAFTWEETTGVLPLRLIETGWDWNFENFPAMSENGKYVFFVGQNDDDRIKVTRMIFKDLGFKQGIVIIGHRQFQFFTKDIIKGSSNDILIFSKMMF
jgi:hypothetical protein